MSTTAIPVNIQILDKEYMVSCPEDEKDSLLASARLLNERMKQVRDGGKVLGLERMAVVTALNIIHEFSQKLQAHNSQSSELNAHVKLLEGKISSAIGRRIAAKELD